LRKRRSPKAQAELLNSAAVFAALGDRTRLRLVFRLCRNGPTSITKLASGFDITRQAITKHLRSMEHSGLIRGTRHGREMIWELNRHQLGDVRHYLNLISEEWNAALGRLREYVER
jgi:DNA-binding transcriptional ArsR family regulator